MISNLCLVGRACFLGLALLMMGSPASFAQAGFNLEITEDPESYVSDLLYGIETDGASHIRELFEQMGLNNPQNDAAISIYEDPEGATVERWTEVMGVVESGNSLKQFY